MPARIKVLKRIIDGGVVTTDSSGNADVTFKIFMGKNLPYVAVSPEAQPPPIVSHVSAQITVFRKDAEGNYTGFRVRTFDPTGAAEPYIKVHWLAIKT